MINNVSYLTFPRLMLLVLAMGVLALSACDQDFTFDESRSINVFYPGPKFPNYKKLSKVQQKAIDELGKPEAFRLLWSADGKIKVRNDLMQQFQGKRPKLKDLPPHSWLYTEKNQEVVFSGETWKVRPISEPLKLVMDYGDPEDVQAMNDGITQWTFFSVGKMYKIYNEKVIETKEFPAMGRYLK